MCRLLKARDTIPSPDSADACWRPNAKTNIGTPYTIKDRGTSHLAWPAVHHTDAWDYPCPKGVGVR